MHVIHLSLIIFQISTLLMAFSLLFLQMVYMYQVDPRSQNTVNTFQGNLQLFLDRKSQRKGAEKTKTLKKKKRKHNPTNSEMLICKGLKLCLIRMRWRSQMSSAIVTNYSRSPGNTNHMWIGLKTILWIRHCQCKQQHLITLLQIIIVGVSKNSSFKSNPAWI